MSEAIPGEGTEFTREEAIIALMASATTASTVLAKTDEERRIVLSVAVASLKKLGCTDEELDYAALFTVTLLSS